MTEKKRGGRRENRSPLARPTVTRVVLTAEAAAALKTAIAEAGEDYNKENAGAFVSRLLTRAAPPKGGEGEG